MGPRPDAERRERGDGDAPRDGVAHCLDRHARDCLGMVGAIEGSNDDGGVRQLCHGGRDGVAEVSGLVVAFGRVFSEAAIFKVGLGRVHIFGRSPEFFPGLID